MPKDHLPLHKKALPYFLVIFGLLVGLGLAIDWDIKIAGIWDVSFKAQFWDIIASVGSLLAGIGTVGLLIFGWLKANEWIKQIRTQAKINLTIKTAERFASEASSLSLFINIHTNGKSQLDLTMEGGVSDVAHTSLSETSPFTTENFLLSIREKSASIDLLFGALHPILKGDHVYKKNLDNWSNESIEFSIIRAQLESQLLSGETLNFSRLKDNALWRGVDARAIFTICLTRELQL